MISDVEHLSICLLVICIYSRKMSIQIFCPFLDSFFAPFLFTEEQLICSISVHNVSSDSVIHMHILFHIPFHYGLLEDTENYFLCYTAELCCLFYYILIRGYICNLKFLIYPSAPFLFGSHKFIFYICEFSFCFLNKFV